MFTRKALIGYDSLLRDEIGFQVEKQEKFIFLAAVRKRSWDYNYARLKLFSMNRARIIYVLTHPHRVNHFFKKEKTQNPDNLALIHNL